MQDETFVVQLTVSELDKLIVDAIKKAMVLPDEERDINDYFDGQSGLADYLQCSIPSAGKVMKKLEPGGAVRVGKRFRIYKWAVDHYLTGRTCRQSS